MTSGIGGQIIPLIHLFAQRPEKMNFETDPKLKELHPAPVSSVVLEPPKPEIIPPGDQHPDLVAYLGSLAGWKPNETITSAKTDVYRTRYEPESGDLKVYVDSDKTLEEYKAVSSPEEWEMFESVAGQLKGKKILHINATAAGGGVAIMRKPEVHQFQLAGVDVQWMALSPNPAGANVTKNCFHNQFQGVAEPGNELTEERIKEYESWITQDAPLMKDAIRGADVIIIDDWQPHLLINYIKDGYTEETPDGPVFHPPFNPSAPILFRDHIHTRSELMELEGHPANTAWEYVWKTIKRADAFITHPKDEFIPPGVPDEKVWFMPATIDKLDDLNRDLSNEEIEQGFEFVNKNLFKHMGQKPIDRNRPYIALVARFDESKGMPEGMESYAMARAELVARGVPKAEIPQLVMIGNGSVDDPSGPKELKKIMDLREGIYGDVMDDIKVARVPHNDKAINAVLRSAKLALQPSLAEGFESRVTDAIFLGVPVIGSDRGGIPLQIIEGKSGYVLPPAETRQWADRIVDLMTNHDHYLQLKLSTRDMFDKHNSKFTTVRNAIRWMALSAAYLKQRENPDLILAGNRRWPEEILS